MVDLVYLHAVRMGDTDPQKRDGELSAKDSAFRRHPVSICTRWSLCPITGPTAISIVLMMEK